MHSTTKMFLDQRHGGIAPPAWGNGDTFFQKARFIAATAWSLTKDPADPELPNCDLSHQEACVGIAENIIDGAEPDPTPYARKVAELVHQLPKEQLKR